MHIVHHEFVKSSIVIPTHRPNENLQSVAREYFASSNFLNRRILTDITAVEKSYDGKWEGMQEKEKEKVAWQIIW